MKDKVLQLISQIMDTDIATLNVNSSSKSVDNWDSLHHMNLIVAIEEEFEIELSDEQIVEMISYKKIIQALES